MNQVEVAQELSKRTGLARSICGAIVGEIFTLIQEEASRGGVVSLPGFGVFRCGKPGGTV